MKEASLRAEAQEGEEQTKKTKGSLGWERYTVVGGHQRRVFLLKACLKRMTYTPGVQVFLGRRLAVRTPTPCTGGLG